MKNGTVRLKMPDGKSLDLPVSDYQIKLERPEAPKGHDLVIEMPPQQSVYTIDVDVMPRAVEMLDEYIREKVIEGIASIPPIPLYDSDLCQCGHRRDAHLKIRCRICGCNYFKMGSIP